MNNGIEAGPVAVDSFVDLLVVGSGTGLAAALTANELGLNVIVIEKTDLVGGSTARSGGAFWVPANDTIAKSGGKDTKEQAERYLKELVGDSGPEARWRSFLNHGNAALAMLLRNTPLEFFWAKGYSDYHPETPGGSAIGRTCECKPFDINRLGKDKGRFRRGVMEASLPMPVTGADYKWLNLIKKKPMKALPRAAWRLAQGVGGKIAAKEMVAGGQATAAGMFAGVLEHGIPVWTRTTFKELLMEDGIVVGATVEQDGKTVTVKTTRGVIMAAGGYDHNMPWRHEYQSPSLPDNISFGSPGNVGEGISLIQDQTNADLAQMGESWWFPAFAPPGPGELPSVMLAERSLPGSYIINQDGERFINEAKDYMSFGQDLLRLEREGKKIEKMWMIFDQEYRNSYLFAGGIMPGQDLPQRWYDIKIAFKASSPQDLAEQLGVPADAFNRTHGRFNKMAVEGKDEDYHRGESAYDRYYGDPTNTPNPNLRAVNQGTLYAVEMVLSDLGTCGGLKADEYGRVLSTEGDIITGLYAIGNNAGNAFGNRYPGAGATIGQGLVFGYIAAMHAAGKFD